MMKKVFLIVLTVLSVLCVATCALSSCGGSSGGSDKAASNAAVTKQVINAALQYLKDGDCVRFMTIAEKNLNGVDEKEKGGIMYLMSRCYLKAGHYDKGKTMIMDILKTRYDAVTDLLGDREKVRTLAAALFAGEAGKRGKVEDVQEVQKVVEKDATLDRILVRDAEGSLVSRTKLSYVLKFHEARAYKNSDKAQQALSILKELSFSSGKIMVDGKIEGLREAVDKMTAEIKATASVWFEKVFA